MTYFKSSLDRKLLELLWNKYWVNTLSSSSLLTVRGQPRNVKMFANCLTVWFMAKLLLYNSLGRAVTGPRCGDLLQPNSQKFAFIDFGNKLNLNFLTLSSGLLKPRWAPAKHLRRGSSSSSSSPPRAAFSWRMKASHVNPHCGCRHRVPGLTKQSKQAPGLAKHWALWHSGGRWID